VLSEIAKSFTSMRVCTLPGLRGQPHRPAQRHRPQDRLCRRRHMDEPRLLHGVLQALRDGLVQHI
jgi:hypothetical protein